MVSGLGSLLQIEDLKKTFRLIGGARLVAVMGVSFSVEAGEAVGLIGESGSGKTTVGRCVGQLIRPDSGRIVWGLTRKPRIGMVFQDPRSSMNPKFRLWESIADPLLAAGTHRGRERIASAVREVSGPVGLTVRELLAFPDELPDETLQRASLARAMIIKPDLLILDEPTTSLDADARAGVLSIINRLRNRRDLGILLISHDLRGVRNVTDRVCIMYLGSIMEVGSTSEVFRGPIHPYTRALLGSHLEPNPEEPPAAVGLRGEIPNPLARPPGCPLAPRCPWAVEVCVEAVPTLDPMADNHLVACVRASELVEGGHPLNGNAVAEREVNTSGG